MAIQFGEFCYTFVSHTTNIFLPLQILVIWQPRNVPTVHPQVQSLVSSAARLLGYIWSKMFDLNDSTYSQSRGATLTLHPGSKTRHKKIFIISDFRYQFFSTNFTVRGQTLLGDSPNPRCTNHKTD